MLVCMFPSIPGVLKYTRYVRVWVARGCHGRVNSLLYSVADGLMRRLRSVQNATMGLVSGAQCYDHVTPTLRQLHWLTVRQRVLFKTDVLVFRCLTGLASSYLVEDYQVVSDFHPPCLRSSVSLTIWHVSLNVQKTLTVIGVLLQPGCGSGTPCRLNCDNATLSHNLNDV